MKKVLIINGENYWQDFMPEFEVIQKTVQHSSWVLKDGELFVVDSHGVIRPDAILWRVGAIKPSQIQTTALNLIDLSGVPCINAAATLKIGYDRLSMLATLKKLGLPTIDFHVVTRSTLVHNVQIDFPFVVKAGNYHGGYGKVLIESEKKWQDVKDLLFITDDYITTEPYIDYLRDLRYLIIGDKVWAMSRKGKYWKANVETVDYESVEPDQGITRYLKKLQQDIGAVILAMDILEEKNGEIHIVEYNDIPGLSGFSDDLKYELIEALKLKMA